MDASVWIQVITLITCMIIVTGKDYYELHGIKRNTSDRETKRCFRQLGMEVK